MITQRGRFIKHLKVGMNTMECYWFEIIGEDSILLGEQLLVEADNIEEAQAKVGEEFPDEITECHGTVSEEEADEMGFEIIY